MPRIPSASRAARAAARNATARLSPRARKATYLERLLVAFHDAFNKHGTKDVSVEYVLDQVKNMAENMSHELGNRTRSYLTAGLSCLRRAGYIQHTKYDRDDNTDDVCMTDNMEKLLAPLDEALEPHADCSDEERFFLTIDYFRRKIRPASRRLPTRPELEEEIVGFGLKFEELKREYLKAQAELDVFKSASVNQNAGAVQQASGLHIQRQDTLIINEHDSGSTGSMDGEAAGAAPQTPSRSSTQESLRAPLTPEPIDGQNNALTPVRQPSLLNPASFYRTPESPRPLVRTDSQLVSPPATPDPSRRPSPSMPGGLNDDAFGDEDEDSMDIDNDGTERGLVLASPVRRAISWNGMMTPNATPVHQSIVVVHSFWPGSQQRREETPAGQDADVCHGCVDKEAIIKEKDAVIEVHEATIKAKGTTIQGLTKTIIDFTHTIMGLNVENVRLQAGLTPD